MKHSSRRDHCQSALAPLFRSDGSARHDLLLERGLLEDRLPADVLRDPGVRLILRLAEQGTFQPLQEALGNIDAQRFSLSRGQIAAALCEPVLSKSRYADRIRRILENIAEQLRMREPNAAMAQGLVAKAGALSRLAAEARALDQSCRDAGNDPAQQGVLRESFWRLWEYAWVVRMFSPDNSAIETLEAAYAAHRFLEARGPERCAIQPPGKMLDPRIEGDAEVVFSRPPSRRMPA